MALHALWTPGYTARAQFTGRGALLQINGTAWSDVVGLREGFGVTFRIQNGQANWFHFAIPTPVIVNGDRAKLMKVFVLYSIDPWALLKTVTIWDGPKQLKSITALAFTGSHSNAIDQENSFDGINAKVQFGIGISVLIGCAPGLDANITFTSTGAEFDI